MSNLRRFAAMMLAIIISTQNVAAAYAETADVLTPGTNSAVAAVELGSSEIARHTFEDSGDSYTLCKDDIVIRLSKTYTEGQQLAVIGRDETSLSFYPETVGGLMPKTEKENQTQEQPLASVESAEDPAGQPTENEADILPTDDAPETEGTGKGIEESPEENAVGAPAEEIPAEESPASAETEAVEQSVPEQTDSEDTGTDDREEIQIYDSVSGIDLGGAVLYPGAVNEHTDIELSCAENGLNERVTMHRYTTARLSHIFSLEALTPVLSGNSVLLYGAYGALAAEISAPYVFDAAGSSGDITAELEALDSGWRLSYFIDTDWLESAQYPVSLTSSVKFNNTVAGSRQGLFMTMAACQHPNWVGPYESGIGDCYHKTWAHYTCGDCGITLRWEGGYEHAYQTTYTQVSRTQHEVMTACSKCGSVSGTSYEAHADGNGDHVCDKCGFVYYPDPASANLRVSAQGNGTNSRTGYLSLSWNAVADATGYYVAIFNGEVYEYISVGNVTSWSTKGKGIWPTEAEVSAGRYKLHTSGGGAELSVTPGLAYRNVSSAYAGDLNYYVSVIPANNAGYMKQPPANAIKSAKLPDTIPPSQASSVTIEPAVYTNAELAVLKWSGITDYNGSSGGAVSSLGSGSVQYRVDDQSAWTSTGVASGTGSYTLNIGSWEDGTHVIYLRAMDSAGNTSTPQYVTLNVDHTPPTEPQIDLTPKGWSSSDRAKLTWSGISDLYELSRVEYAFDDGGYTAANSSAKEYTDYELDLSALSDGTHTLSVRAVDLAGNVGQASTLTIERDTVAPSAENVLISPDSWTSADELVLSWENLADATSGVRNAWYNIDGGEKHYLDTEAGLVSTIDIAGLSDGEHKLTLCFDDLADNTAVYELPVYKDATAPELSLLSPADASAVNGVVEIWGSAKDISLKKWEISATGSDGETRVLASGIDETDSGLMAMLNCAAYDDGEPVELTLYAEDEAGNSSTVSVNVTALGKSATPIQAEVELTYPMNREAISKPTITGEYSRKTQDSEAEGLLYIDGLYAGDCTGGAFPFDAVTYPEGSMHSISVLSRADSGEMSFSQGLSSLVLLSDIFEDRSYLSSSSGVTLGNGAAATGGGGALVSQPIQLSYPVLSLWLDVTADIPSGSSIAYYYSTDNGTTWVEIAPGTDIPILTPISVVQLRAELNGTPTLYGWTLNGVIETSPTRVLAKLLRPVDSLALADTTVTEAITALADTPDNAETLRLYRDGEKYAESFRFDVRPISDGTVSRVALLARTGENTLSGSSADTAVLLRENVGRGGMIETPGLSSGKPIHAIRLEVLSAGTGAYWYSADRERWHELVPGEYALLDAAAEQVYIKAEMGASTLTAWHIEGVSCRSSSVTAGLVQAPADVRAIAWGEEYYANEKLRRYDLSWTDPNSTDETAPNTTTYEVYRNGAPLATVGEAEYTDTDYIPSPWYDVYIVRSYEGYERRVSAPTRAVITRMKAAEKPQGVSYTPQEEKQSEYLDALYGGNYTFSDEPRIPDGDDIVLLARLGLVDLCSYGLEPINFNTGNFLLETLDGQWTDMNQTVALRRSYNTQSKEENGLFGAKWSSPLNEHLILYTEGDVFYCSGLGAQLAFRYTAEGYSCGEDAGYRLTAAESEYRVTCPDGTTHGFTGAGLLKYIESRQGSRTEYERDEDGLLTAVILPSGRRLEITTNEDGHITQIATLGGSALEYSYQGANLVSFTDANGGTTRYVYDRKGRMTEWYDAEGNRQVKNIYDDDDRVIGQLDALGGKSSLEYFDDYTVTTDAEGNVSEIWFDELKRTVKTVDASGGVVLYEYNAAGQIAAITNETGGITRYEYDAAGHVTKQTAPDGGVQKFAYDESGNLISATDALENTTLYEYNEDNLLIKETAPDGGVTTYAYNANGQTTAITDALGNVTRFEYDGALLVKSTDANGSETSYAYDAEDRLISTTDALGNTTRFAYDNAGNLTAVTFADGTEISYTYDAVGNVLTQTDALGNVTAFEYDALSQLVRTVYSDGTETRSKYDLSGNVISSTDANGNTVTAGYDGMGNLLTATDPMGNTVTNAYDAAGRLLSETMPNGGTAKYHYDINGNLSSVETATGEVTTYAYDAAGNLTAVTAPDGGTVSFTYDAMGRLLTETDASGAVTAYTYDAAGRLSTRTDALGNITSYTFDAVGNVLSITDALGGITAYEYDALGRMISVTDANGATTTYEYNAVGSLIRETDALGSATEYAYDANGSITGLTDALGGKTALSYDELGQVTDILQKGGGTLSTEYDAAGNLLSSTDALGNATSYEYNANGLVTRITDALEQSAEISYDALGNVSEISSPDGGKTAYTYDLSGRLLSETDAMGTKTAYAYDSSGRLSKTTVNGNETAYEYDLRGNLTAVTDAEGRRIELKYDALGNLTALAYPDGSYDTYIYDALSRLVRYTPRGGEAVCYTYNAMGDVLTVTQGKNTTAYEYDLLGRPTAVIDAAGARTETAYDVLGHVISQTDALGNSTLYSYTAAELLETVEFANGGKWRLGYDLAGNLLTETDPEGGETAYEYDPVGRITAVTDALGSTTRYSYDAADNLTAVIDARGNITGYEYDLAGNLLSETDALGNTVSYTYTPEGWLETATDGSGNITRYTYDATGNVLTEDYAGQQHAENSYNEIGLLTTVTTEVGETKYQYDAAGRLISVTQPNGDTVSYTYDLRGNRLSLTYPDGRTVKYSYDDLNRLIKVKGLDGDTTKYSYDELGRRVKTDGSKEDTVYTYDEMGNLVSQTTTGAYDLALEYSYDKSGRMTQESRTENGVTVESRYVYDALGQLTSFTRSDGYAESYAYDPAGNMTAKTADGVKTNYSYNAANQLTRSVTNGSTTRYSYDANGNLTSKTNADGTTAYSYNALNLLESWTNGEYSEEYTYNAAGLLSTITTAESATTLTWDLLYSEGVVISAVQDGETTDYTYGLERISASTGNSRTEYVYDGRGSVAGEVSYSTAWYTLGGLLSKKTVETKAYTPFGEQLGEAVSGFGYNGEYYNAATGMLYLRARFFEPEINRFSQKDSKYSSDNEYLYCYNNPVLYADHDGWEAIVVSGGVFHQSDADKANGYTFIASSIRELRLLQNQIGDQELVTWIIADAGWTEEDKGDFSEVAEDIGVNIVYISSADELTSYYNTKYTDSSNGTRVSNARLNDQITYISYYSHGIISKENPAGTITLAYDSGIANPSVLDIDASTVNRWACRAFNHATIKIYACNIATSKENSLAQSIAVRTSSTVYAYYGKSDYSNIMGVNNRSPYQKIADKISYALFDRAFSQAGRLSDAAYAVNPNVLFPWFGALYSPTDAGFTINPRLGFPYYTMSQAYMATPNGNIGPAPGNKIPDLIGKKSNTTNIIKPTLTALNKKTTTSQKSTTATTSSKKASSPSIGAKVKNALLNVASKVKSWFKK